MFLQRLIERAAGDALVLRPAPLMAKVLDDPAWGPAPPDADEGEDASEEAAAPTPAARRKPPRFALRDAPPPEHRAPRPAEGAPAPTAAGPDGAPGDSAAASTEGAPPPPASPSPLPAAPVRPLAGAPPAPASRERTEAANVPVGSQALAAAPQPALSPRPSQSPVSARLPPVRPEPAPPRPERAAPLAAAPPSQGPDSVEIVVEIGRIDLVPPPAASPHRPASQAAAPRPGPKLTLAQYLESRRGARR